MSLKDLPIKIQYKSSEDDLISDFYIPALCEARKYDRISGYFSSTSLAIAARGIGGLIANGGTMRLITCPKLSDDDIKTIQNVIENQNKILEESMITAIEDIPDYFLNDHIAALGWMLANNKLQIKIAIVKDVRNTANNPIMHQKFGILYDNKSIDYGISFSGSNNESASGWLWNDERFEVYKNWNAGQREYFQGHQNDFNSMWNNSVASLEVIDLPTAVKQRLIERGEDYQNDKLSLDRYRENRYHTSVSIITKPQSEKLPFPYQNRAIEHWIECNRIMLLEMATGTGKTFTAVKCLENAQQNCQKLLTIIAIPQITLQSQWKKEIDSLQLRFDQTIVCDSNHTNWKKDLNCVLQKANLGIYKQILIYVTHCSACTDDFIKIIKSYSYKTMLIGDEVHGMGASKTKKSLLDKYDYRLGLSATPDRWFDEEGTNLLKSYFMNNEFTFSLHDALTTINPVTNRTFLVSYKYNIYPINLTENESSEYNKLTKKLSKLIHTKDDDIENNEKYEQLLFKRANIVKNAEHKISALKILLSSISDIRDTIIYVSDKQIDKVEELLVKLNISGHRFTQSESTKIDDKGISEREDILEKFRNGYYQILVAIKCLDEGIDIKTASRAILLSSSENAREYIQRLGRVLRDNGNKQLAYIDDFVVTPDYSDWSNEERNFDKRIFKKEMKRIFAIATEAINGSQAVADITKTGLI